MKVVTPNDTNHIINLIPRFYPSGLLVLSLYNETTKIETEISNTYLVSNGVLTIEFNFNFVEGDKYQFKIKEDYIEIYRGKILATAQDPQNYSQRNNAYYYE